MAQEQRFETEQATGVSLPFAPVSADAGQTPFAAAEEVAPATENQAAFAEHGVFIAAEQAGAAASAGGRELAAAEAQLKVASTPLAAVALGQTEMRQFGDLMVADWMFVFGYVSALIGLLNLIAHAWPTMSGWLMASGLLFALHGYASRYLEVEAAFTLADRGTADIGNLLESLESLSPRERGVAMRLLTRLLPKLTAAEAGRLTWTQRNFWRRSLMMARRRHYTPYLQASLESLARVGSEEDMAAIEALIEQKARGRKARLIREAAFEACAAIERRLYPAQAGDAQNATEQAAPRLLRAGVASELERLRKEKQTHAQPGMRMGFLAATWGIIVPYLAYWAYNWYCDGSPLEHKASFLIGAGALGCTQLYRLALSPKQVKAAKQLAKESDVHGVGALAEALEWPDTQVRRIAGNALISLLPQLRASDAGLLGPRQRECLHNVLKMRNAASESALMLAILKAWEQVGDASALPVVERLARSSALTNRQRRVRDAALQCLPYLHNRADATRGHQTLLRASSPSEIAPVEVLLRPAQASVESDSGQLLRAGSGFIDQNRNAK